ncbi:unnamed protein product [Musa textilis]
MYGIALAASGMLGTIATYMANDNAARIAEMTGMVCKLCEITDALDASGDTTAAIGKVSLVSVTLFGAFISRARIMAVNVLSPIVFNWINCEAMLPHCFSAMAMTGVGKAALKMCQDDKMSTDASLKEMIPPDALVILTPLVVGNFFGVHTCSSCWLTGSCRAGCYLIFEHRWGLIRIMQRNTWSPSVLLSSDAVSIYPSVVESKTHMSNSIFVGSLCADPLKDTS